MKKISASILGATLLFTAAPTIASAHGSGQTQAHSKITFNNLIDQTSQNQLKKTMQNNGIKSASISKFFYSVNQYNVAVKQAKLKSGYQSKTLPSYNDYLLQDLWDKKYPNFVGNDCRITAMTLMKDNIKVKHPKKADLNMLMFDIDSLENNPKPLLTAKEQMNFENIFGAIPTKMTKNRSIHAKAVQQYWNNRGVTFNNSKAHMISMYFHSNIDKSQLFIGHVGVLFPQKDGKLLFVEKLAFQAPYQEIRFNNRTELYNYLMKMHNKDQNQPTAEPFIMENNKVMKH